MRSISLVIIIFLTVLASGCSDGQQAVVRFKVTATAEVEGKAYQGSTVMEVTWSKGSSNPFGLGSAASAKGEALVLDMAGRGKMFILPWQANPDGSFSPYYELALLDTLTSKAHVSKMKDEDFETMRALPLGKSFVPNYHDKMTKLDFQPVMISISVPENPASVREVTKENFNKFYGPNATFKGLRVVITDEPVTKGIVLENLPLLKQRSRIWSQRPIGVARLQLPPMSERPMNWRMGPSLFYAYGNW